MSTEQTQIAPSASTVLPSGVTPPGSVAHSRRPVSDPSGSMSNAVSRPPQVSLTTRVRVPGSTFALFGNTRPSAASRAEPSWSTT